MHLTWGLHELAEFCVGKGEVAPGHGDQERKVPRDTKVTTVESRVDVTRRVSFRKPSAHFELCLDSRLIPGTVNLALEARQERCFELLQGGDGLACHESVINMSAHDEVVLIFASIHIDSSNSAV
eukprot:2099210-Rhodomonas_salina.1